MRSRLRVRIQDAAAATSSELNSVPENPAEAREPDEQHSVFQRLIQCHPRFWHVRRYDWAV